MPFDPPQTRLQPTGTTPGVALWLFGLCGLVLVMVTLGGVTRLTGSGLSIMEWAPIMGALPPLSDTEWQRLFALYQRIPQYALVNQDFGIEGFKGIFWLEWSHRAWGRAMGLAFALPLAWFALRGGIGRRLGIRLVVLLALGGLQGAVGWIMVASGFDDGRIAVSPYRLVAHLALAMALHAGLLWTALDIWRGARLPLPARAWRVTAAACAMVALTMLAGGFVAGLKAGLTYNTFPLMDGRLVPEGYAALQPFLLNLFENVAAVQFDHRLLATATALLVVAAAALGWRGPGRAALATMAGAAALQYAVGVATLLHAVPATLGALHQALAMLLLTAALVALHVQRNR